MLRLLENEYIVQALISLGVAVLTLLGGYLIYGPKLRKQQKLEFQKEIGKKKAEVLLDYKDLIEEVNTFEVYDIQNKLESGTILSIKDPDIAYYPAIMNDWDSFNTFFEHLSALRRKERYLDLEAAAYLLYLYRYTFELRTFKSALYPKVDLPTFGAIIIVDLNNWAHKVEEVVVNDINKASITIEKRVGEKWEATRDKVFDELYDSSMLQLMQCKDETLTPVQKQVKEQIEGIFKVDISSKQSRSLMAKMIDKVRRRWRSIKK